MDSLSDQWTAVDESRHVKILGSGVFDMVFYDASDDSYSFLLPEATPMHFSRVMDEMTKVMGDFTSDNDYIPEMAANDLEFLGLLVKDDRAEIIRFWEPPIGRYHASVIWNDGGLFVKFYWNETFLRD